MSVISMYLVPMQAGSYFNYRAFKEAAAATATQVILIAKILPIANFGNISIWQLLPIAACSRAEQQAAVRAREELLVLGGAVPTQGPVSGPTNDQYFSLNEFILWVKNR